MSDPLVPKTGEVRRPASLWVPRGGGAGSHQALYRELISRVESLQLAPGDILTVTFPREVYDSDRTLRDAERFVQQLANLVKKVTGRDHQALILKEGTEIGVTKKPEPVARVTIGDP